MTGACCLAERGCCGGWSASPGIGEEGGAEGSSRPSCQHTSFRQPPLLMALPVHPLHPFHVAPSLAYLGRLSTLRTGPKLPALSLSAQVHPHHLAKLIN